MKFTEKVRRLLLPMVLALVLAVPVRATCNHDFVDMREEPGCENDGLSWLQCRLCGFSTGYEPLPPTGHTFDEGYILTAPTCTKDGLLTHECMVCGDQETEALPRLGHDYVEELVPPTCTARGKTVYECARCHDRFITDETPPLGHQYDGGVLIKEPTETTLGRIRFTCIRCSESYLMTYKFRDIASETYYFAPVIWAVNRGITSGLDETHFGPYALCNRAQVVTFLWRAAGKPEPKSMENPFLDVAAGSFYEKAVLWAFETGITTGTDASHFSPELPCNRAQVVTFLHRSRGCPEPTATTSFPDVSSGSFYHKAVLWAARREITLGMDGGFFRPELSCSRAQIVTFLYRDANNP